MKLLSRTAAALALLLALSSLPAAAAAPGEVNLYSYRQPYLIQPLLETFTRETGIKVNTVYVQRGMLERLKATPGSADVVLTADVGNLHDMDRAGLLQPVKSPRLEQNIPAPFRHPKGHWFGLTLRGRVIYASKERVKPGAITTYEDLADPKWKGKVCIRSGKHVYNISLFASMIADRGEEFAQKWLQGLKANLARKPSGGDRDQAQGIHAGQCDVALGNTYYLGGMATNQKKPEQQAWYKAIYPIFPNQSGRGTHMNISGGALAKAARNAANGVKLLEFLSSPAAQKIYAQQNFEYPVHPGVEVHPLVKSWGEFKKDTVNLAQVAEAREKASRLVDAVDFNNYRN